MQVFHGYICCCIGFIMQCKVHHFLGLLKGILQNIILCHFDEKKKPYVKIRQFRVFCGTTSFGY